MAEASNTPFGDASTTVTSSTSPWLLINNFNTTVPCCNPAVAGYSGWMSSSGRGGESSWAAVRYRNSAVSEPLGLLAIDEESVDGFESSLRTGADRDGAGVPTLATAVTGGGDFADSVEDKPRSCSTFESEGAVGTSALGAEMSLTTIGETSLRTTSAELCLVTSHAPTAACKSTAAVTATTTSQRPRFGVPRSLCDFTPADPLSDRRWGPDRNRNRPGASGVVTSQCADGPVGQPHQAEADHQ